MAYASGKPGAVSKLHLQSIFAHHRLTSDFHSVSLRRHVTVFFQLELRGRVHRRRVLCKSHLWDSWNLQCYAQCERQWITTADNECTTICYRYESTAPRFDSQLHFSRVPDRWKLQCSPQSHRCGRSDR